MDEQYLNAVVTFVVGLLALVVYKMQRTTELRNAANIILMDVRHAEQVVAQIVERQVINKDIRPLLIDNNWNKYKHLFASRFSQDDFEAFNRFFAACTEVTEAHQRMTKIFYSGIEAKAAYVQQKLLDIEDISTPEGQAERDRIIMRASQEGYLFEPGEPRDIVFKNLSFLSRLSVTMAFHKLSRIAGGWRFWLV